jgi:hypothetical protein
MMLLVIIIVVVNIILILIAVLRTWKDISPKSSLFYFGYAFFPP